MSSGRQGTADAGEAVAAAQPATACHCMPRGAGRAGDAAPALLSAASRRDARAAAVPIPGGRSFVGTDRTVIAADGEGPRRAVTLRPFALDATAVTNARFAAFVDATGFVSEAERFGWSFVFDSRLPDAGTAVVPGAAWWRRVDGACWRRPQGPGSAVDGRPDHPVVHISFNDAAAFAAWSGGRLPSEAEWEHAARGGLHDAVYPWGDAPPDEAGPHRCNIWQGRFPDEDVGADGYAGTAPVRAFAPNGYGLYNMCGNAWEWSAEIFRVRSLKRAARQLNDAARVEQKRILKGGSYLCHRSYCFRYRIAARIGNPPDTTACHIGFRVAYD
ncbi:formylglycine-generating enzyme family protein [Vineibacter terrae]|uniref:formylglycine-generating enzyme family protein n=1 Tax=Vineibacter terrae TaxID=2586908 RepID=UPI002E312A99|nr:formylglycine-generating enzyme family protein [Vineibacter terrae]HEX2885191.1 formylglycine-generating enzyme family protein [Vineibacter terrae]